MRYCSEQTRGVQGIGMTCGNKATIEVGGKWFCTRHSPESVKRRQAAERTAAKLGEVMSSARYRVRGAERLAIDALLAWDGRSQVGALRDARQRVIDATDAYTKAKSAADANGKVPRTYYKY
jgi:hypothetical protein